MKKKNVMLAIAAFGLAIGSAFASLMAPEDVYVRGIMVPGGQWECINTGVKCDHAGGLVCTVEVPLRPSGTAIASSSGNPLTYKAGCATTLHSASTTTQVSGLSGNNRPLSIQ